MKIGVNEVILSGQSDGSRQREINLLGALNDALVENRLDAVFYAASDISSEFLGQLSRRLKSFPVKVAGIPSRPTVQRVLKGAMRWQKILSEDGCDVFHTSYYPVPKVRQRVVLTVNDLRYLTFPETYSTTRLWFLRHTVPRAIARADVVFAISDFTKAEICNAYRVDPEKVVVTPVARDEAFRPITDRQALENVREKYSLPQQFLLSVGHLEPRKNIPRVVEAFKEIQARGWSDLFLVVVGRPSLRWREIMAAIGDSDLGGKLRFTGFVDDEDMAGLYNLAEMLVFPSLHEGFGIPLLEAMGCGLPVVASDSTALVEVAGDAAVLVNPLSTEAIADGIEKILSSPTVAEDCFRKGLKRVKDFDARPIASVIAQAYQTLS
jgi:glycosyltransferase involved in cell wall biosynthesis